MLLLLTVGLLLIGLVTLVIGFLNSSLVLDYISIAASALSFTLVLLFTRLGRARSARTAAARARQAPAPLAQNATSVIDLNNDYLGPEPTESPRASRTSRTASFDQPTAYDFEEPVEEDDEFPLEEVNEADETDWEPEPTAPASSRPAAGPSPYERPSSRVSDVTPPPPVPPPPPPVTAPRSPVAAGRPDNDPRGADRYAEEGYEEEGYDHEGEGILEEEAYDDLDFPIAEYDELRVGEVMPLLDELEPDEVDVVREREISGRNRAVILNKLDEVAGSPGAPVSGGPVSGGAPTARPPAARPPVARPPTARPPVDRPPVARPPAAYDVNGTRRPEAVEPPVQRGYDDDAAGYRPGYDAQPPAAKAGGFPIEDYDDLRLTEVLPLLPKLEPAELEMVRQRELEGERRATLLNRIDALIGTRAPRAPARQVR